MGTATQLLLLSLLAYFLGSIPSGKIVGKIYGVDIQKHGSGNIGFANVRRTLGWRAALPVLAADLFKGFLPVLLAKHYLPPWQVMAVTALAVAGHLFPVWLRFRGGKGVATTIGAAAAIAWPAALAAGAIYLIASAALRVSALASLAAIFCLPVLMLVYAKDFVWLFVGLALVITWTHRSNLKQLPKRYPLGSAQKS